MKRKTLLFCLCLLLGILEMQAQFPSFPPSTVDRTQDRDQMAWQLGITFPTLSSKLVDPNAPPGSYPKSASDPEGDWTDSLGTGNTITRSGWGLWNNYHDRYYGYHPGPDSAKLGDYPPIDLLKMKDSNYVISTADEWWYLRRPEIYKDVTEQMWGVIPDDSILPAVTWEVTTAYGGSGNSAYIQKSITGNINTSRYPAVRNIPRISATLRVPVNSADSVPVMVIINSPGVLDTYWNYCYPEGWGVCIFDPTVLQPDNGSGLTSYLIGLCNKGNWRKPTDWGSLAAWAWGISKLVDYFETDSLIDATKIGVSGHSRYGKATLVTMAYDQRIFIAFPSDAGALGTAMNRRHYGQNLENSVWDQEYHWMAGNFMKWGGERTPGQYMPRKIYDCPVDAHSLMSLCAPRPVYCNGGTQSTWIDPYGVFLTTKETTPVYELLGLEGIIMNDPKPVVEKAYIEGTLAYRYHEGGHTDQPDWPDFWKFAKKYCDIPSLSLSKNMMFLSDTANSTDSFTIASDTTWTIGSSESWITLNLTSGSHNNSILVTINEDNASDTGRSAVLTVMAPGMKKQYVTIYQSSANPSLSINYSGDTLTNSADTAEFSIVSNTAWSLSNTATWLNVEPTTGLNNKTIKLVAQANSTAAVRADKITVSALGLNNQTVIIIQEASIPTLQLATFDWNTFQWVPITEIIIGADDTTTMFYAPSNCPNPEFTISEDWLTMSSTYLADYQFHIINIVADTNPDTIARESIFTATVPGLAPKTITIIQLGDSVATTIPDAVKDIDLKNDIKVLPNPFKNQFTIIIANKEFDYTLLDFTGKQILSKSKLVSSAIVDLADFPAGVYYLKVSESNQTHLIKLLKV